MNKAIELLEEWVNNRSQYLEILIDRRDTQQKWSEVEDKSDYYLPKYQATKLQVETLEREIVECEQALVILNLSN